MHRRSWTLQALVGTAVASALVGGAATVRADGNLNNVNHIIIMMQENRSFDNYFGVLPFVPGSPYHTAKGSGRRRACDATDHTCVDGLNCKTKKGVLVCRNSNHGNQGGRVRSFHDPRLCTGPDLDHSWDGSHYEGNFRHPSAMATRTLNDGFVRQNAIDDPPAQVTDHDTMGYYDDSDLPFYYGIAENFAMSDRYFAAVIGQTFPNRAYFLAATSFGHLTTNEILTTGGYKPITGSIFDKLDAAGITWTDYYSDLAYSVMMHTSPGHTKSVSTFAADAAAGTLAQVVFIDPSAFADQTISGHKYETDEHPPQNIQAGQYFISTMMSAVRNSVSWNDSVIFLTYDEHGGFYDHVVPPPADQGGALTPDGIAPGQCADNSNPPASQQPGGGVNCTHSATIDAPGICPTFTPTGPYPANCATFNQLGFRLPFVAVSPFSKPHYVSHVVNSHTSFLAMIEKRFGLTAIAARDAHADTLEDLFDFDTSPSATTPVGTAPLPVFNGRNCPFSGSPSGAFLE
jgi:phospholipase C